MPHILPFINALSAHATHGFIRYPLLIEGSTVWCQRVINEFLFQKECPYSTVEVYGDMAIGEYSGLAIKSAMQKLGQETQCLVIDVSHEFNANAINAVSGTLVGGGLVFFIRTNDASLSKSIEAWLAHFYTKMVVISEDKPLPALPVLASTPPLFMENQSILYRSHDQQAAVLGIKKVVTGHAKRPLIITADRGRGKSSAMGIAIAELLCDRQLRIGVTAPLRANVNEVFDHAIRVATQLGMTVKKEKNTVIINDSELSYFAPDELIREAYSLDLLCIDEAAAIPAPMLLDLMQRYSRLVFSTTINGYEGTGRGFEIKFKNQLAHYRPNFYSLDMKQPIRWAENDPLEAWLSSVFLLNHHTSNHDNVELNLDELVYRMITVNELLLNPGLAQSLFSLLVSAHYQTSPNDWFSLLTDETLYCWVGMDKNSHQICACALVSLEGELDKELITDIQLGKRRPKGHLAPVLLTQTLCIDEPALQSSVRIMRIAVDPCYQRQRLGSALIEAMKAFYLDHGMDYLSTSFGSTMGLNEFWQTLGFHFVRLGISKDKSSGTHSLLAVLPLSSEAYSWQPIALEYFSQALPEQLITVFNKLEAEEVLSLLSDVSVPFSLSEVMLKRIDIYANGGIGVEVIQYELRHFVLSSLSLLNMLDNRHQALVVMKIVQLRDWKDVIQCVNMSGRKEAEAQMRLAIRLLLSNLHCKS